MGWLDLRLSPFFRSVKNWNQRRFFSSMKSLEIDGSKGGGQIVRNSFSLAALLKKDIHIKNVRKLRDNPGLKLQHVCGIKFISLLCNGKLQGAYVSSSFVYFAPGEFDNTKGTYIVNTGVGVSVTLLAQICLPCLVFRTRPTTLILRGATNVTASPQLEDLINVLKPTLQKFGINFDIAINNRGVNSERGEIKLFVKNVTDHLKPIKLTNRGKITQIYSRAFVCRYSLKEAKIMNSAAKETLQNILGNIENLNFSMKEIDTTNLSTGRGAWITIFAKTDTNCVFTGSVSHKEGLDFKEVGVRAAKMLGNDLLNLSTLDICLQDQVIIYMALAKGTSEIHIGGELTKHTLNSMHFAELLTGAKFTTKVIKNELPPHNEIHILQCEGIGYTIQNRERNIYENINKSINLQTDVTNKQTQTKTE